MAVWSPPGELRETAAHLCGAAEGSLEGRVAGGLGMRLGIGGERLLDLRGAAGELRLALDAASDVLEAAEAAPSLTWAAPEASCDELLLSVTARSLSLKRPSASDWEPVATERLPAATERAPLLAECTPAARRPAPRAASAAPVCSLVAPDARAERPLCSERTPASALLRPPVSVLEPREAAPAAAPARRPGAFARAAHAGADVPEAHEDMVEVPLGGHLRQ